MVKCVVDKFSVRYLVIISLKITNFALTLNVHQILVSNALIQIWQKF